MAAVRTLTRGASALALTRHARASPSPSCAASRSHAVRARVHELPRVSVGSPRGKSAAPSAALASGSHRVCAVPLALLAHPNALGVCSHPTHRHPLAAAARQRRAVGRGQPRAGVQAGAQGADGAARRGLAAGHGAAHQQREARPHAVEKNTSRRAAEDTGYIPPPGLYIHTFCHKWPLSPRLPSVTCPRGRGCARTWVFMCAWVCGVAWQARERASVTCLAPPPNPTAPTGDRAAHPGRADV